jgi:hypothetical protein
MNFSTECIEHLVSHASVMSDIGLTSDATFIKNVTIDLLESKKFLIPSPGHLNVVATKASLKFIKLPYPVCAFEYSVPDARDEGMVGLTHATTRSTRRIALVYDCTKDVGPVALMKRHGLIPGNASGILVQSLYYVDLEKMWTASMALGYVDEEVINESEHFLISNTRVNVQVDACPLLTQSIDLYHRDTEKDYLIRALLSDIADEVGMAIRACLLLNTRNLKVIQAVQAPVQLNKKRAKKNRAPFFEYYTLDIFVSDDASRFSRKRVDSNYIREKFANMNTQHRWGSVRGHFKHRSTGIFWWNDYTRGSKAVGIVDKDYRVRKKLEPNLTPTK